MARKSRKEQTANQAINPTPAKEIYYNVGLYIRLSVMDSGKADGESILNQQEMLKRYVAERPELTLQNIFVDNGETGVDYDRPAWNDLMRDCRNGKINCIIVRDLSRLGRNYIETGELLEKILPMLGARLISVNDNYDNLHLTHNEQLVANLKNLINDIYAKDISKKVCSSLKTKKEKGEFIGSYAPYGFLKDPENHNKLVVNPETKDIIQLIFELKAKGASNRSICHKLNTDNIPSPNRYRFERGITKNKKHENCLWIDSTVSRLLRCHVYAGHMTQGKWSEALYEGKKRRATKRDEWIVVPNTHEAIVSQELFDKANAVMDKRKADYDKVQGHFAHFEKPEYILQGLIFCADCGKSLMRNKMVYKNGKTYFWKYACRTHDMMKMCSNKFIREKDLVNVVYSAIRLEMKKFSDTMQIIKKLNGESDHKSRLASFDTDIEKAEHEIKRITILKQAVFEDYATKLLTASEYQFATEKYNADTEKEQQRLERAKKEKEKFIDSSTPTNKWLMAYSRFMDDKELTREMAQTLIEKVEVSDRDKVTVYFKFRDEQIAIRKYAKGVVA